MVAIRIVLITTETYDKQRAVKPVFADPGKKSISCYQHSGIEQRFPTIKDVITCYHLIVDNLLQRC